MKPHDRPTRKHATKAAARTYLRAHLGWLRGFPCGAAGGDGVAWTTLPPLESREKPESLTIDRERIRRAEYSRTAARQKFPAALRQVVGDVDAWTRRTDIQLGFLKAALHDRAPLPGLDALLKAGDLRRPVRQRAARIAATGEDAATLVTALVWLNWTDEAALPGALDILERYQTELTQLRARLGHPDWLALALQSIALIADGCDPAFLALLADERCWEIPTTEGGYGKRLKDAVRTVRSGQQLDARLLAEGVERPRPRLGRDIAAFVSDLSTSLRRTRLRQATLLKLIVTDALLEDWAAWWANADALERAMRRLGGRLRAGDDVFPAGARLEKQAQELGRRSVFSLKPLQGTIFRVSDAASPKAFEALAGCLEHAVDCFQGKPAAQGLLERWSTLLADPTIGRGVVTRLLEAQRDLLSRLGGNAEHRIWAAQDLQHYLIDEWIHSAKPQRLIEPVMQALRVLMRTSRQWSRHSGPLGGYSGWDALIGAVELTGDPDFAAACVVAVPPDLLGLNREAWKTLLGLSCCDMERFKALAAKWKPLRWSPALIKELEKLATDPATAALVADALASGQADRIRRVASLASLLRALGARVGAPVPEGSPLDPAPYPAKLHGLLADLALWDPRAERAAADILAKDFPRPEKLERELAAIHGRLATANADDKRALSARARSLKKRLDAPVSVSAPRLENYRAKLERRIRHARLQGWEDQLADAVRVALRDATGAEPLADWLDRDEAMQVLTSLAELGPGFRRLAFRLLCVRCGPEPWDLRDDPKNRAFLQRMKRRGLDVSVWLDGPPPRVVHFGANALSLELERDPLEVMRMGEPFQTCLSPGSFNFFAAVANAADINKRVLYARDANGTIQARCLLALTADGRILTFNVYAHRYGDAIATAIADYVSDLATAMRTAMAPNGTVPNLVAPDWYDDGPSDITGRLKILQPGTKLSEALGSIAPEEVVPTLETALAPDPITPSVVAALIDHQAIQTRPQLFVPLFPHLDREALDPWSRIRVVSLLRRGGAQRAAREIVETLPQALMALEGSVLHVECADEMIALGMPGQALRLIRASRPKGVRDWSGEWTARTMVAARALEHLHRPHRALELYRIAGRNGARDAQRRAAALAAELDPGAEPG